MNHYVYETTNLVNGKKYIGKRSCKCNIEDDKYLGSGVALKDAIKKYGRSNFKKEILSICETVEQAYAFEDFYTLQVNAWVDRKYYNLKRGGKGGTTVSEETRMKMSNAKKGIVPWNVGIPHSEETREKLKKAKIGFVPWMLGEHHSKEAIEKMRKTKLGRKYSQEHKDNIGDSLKKEVICLNNGKIFRGNRECAEYVNIKGFSAISKACKGIQLSAGKINGEPAKWMYYEDYLKLKNDNIEAV